MPAEAGSDYDLVIHDSVEHLIPAGEQYHLAGETCECGPIRARNVLGASRLPTLLHRTLPMPRPL